MSHLHSLLAIYSALDQLVLETGNPAIERLVDRYLPGTAGHAGWSEEIRQFLSDPDNPLPEYPSVDRAINDIIEGGGTTIEGQERPRNGTTESELSRLTYAIAILSKLTEFTPGVSNEALRAGLSLVVPQGENQDENVDNLLHLFQTELQERDDWSEIMLRAQSEGWVRPLIAQIPLCDTRLKVAHNQLCVVLRTEFTSDDVSLDELRNVVDPINWDDCLPFFCRMQQITTPLRDDGWRRVLEVCNMTCPHPPEMRTPLKYWMGPSNAEAATLDPPAAWVNYELDDTPGAAALGDGRVLVDEGYIKMYATQGGATTNGVRVVTKKVVCFRDLSEVAIAILACVSGYGNQGMDMLLDGVAERRKDPGKFVNWAPSQRPSGGTTTKPGDIAVPTGADRPSRRAIVLAMEMADECITEFSKKSSSVANKVATGAMPIPEMIALNTELAVRLATDPWRYLDRLREELRKK